MSSANSHFVSIFKCHKIITINCNKTKWPTQIATFKILRVRFVNCIAVYVLYACVCLRKIPCECKYLLFRNKLKNATPYSVSIRTASWVLRETPNKLVSIYSIAINYYNSAHIVCVLLSNVHIGIFHVHISSHPNLVLFSSPYQIDRSNSLPVLSHLWMALDYNYPHCIKASMNIVMMKIENT